MLKVTWKEEEEEEEEEEEKKEKFSGEVKCVKICYQTS